MPRGTKSVLLHYLGGGKGCAFLLRIVMLKCVSIVVF
jgi:hypothetical protein